jgi:DNA-binding NtrC family response regulator
MVAHIDQLDRINILASQADWAWPLALQNLFQPRGINLLVARDLNEFVNVLKQQRIHTAIIDIDYPNANVAMLKVIRMDYPHVPCIALKSKPQRELLTEVLELDIFGVVNKPVDLNILQQLLNRLFIKKYHSNIFNM